MVTITIDPKNIESWLNHDRVILKDFSGNVLGVFLPEGHVTEDDLFYEELTEEEFQSRMAQGGRRTWSEVLKELEKLQ